jgi:hypothetical protein
MSDEYEYKQFSLGLNHILRVYRDGHIDFLVDSSWDRARLIGMLRLSELNQAFQEITKPRKRKKTRS